MYDLVDLLTGKVLIARMMTDESAYEKNLIFRRNGVMNRWIKDYNSVFQKKIDKENFREFLKEAKNEARKKLRNNSIVQ